MHKYLEIKLMILKANFKTKTSNKKEEKQSSTKTEEEKPVDKNFTDLWSFRSKKRQKL